MRHDARHSYWLILLFLWQACQSPGNRVTDTNADLESLSLSTVNLTDLSGIPVHWDEYQGKTVFVNFWATWCKPCIAEMPSIQKAADLLQDEPVVFLLASDESVEQIDAFQKKYGFQLSFYQVRNQEELGIMALPTTLIFDKKGKLVLSEMGGRDWSDESNLQFIRKTIKGS